MEDRSNEQVKHARDTILFSLARFGSNIEQGKACIEILKSWLSGT